MTSQSKRPDSTDKSNGFFEKQILKIAGKAGRALDDKVADYTGTFEMPEGLNEILRKVDTAFHRTKKYALSDDPAASAKQLKLAKVAAVLAALAFMRYLYVSVRDRTLALSRRMGALLAIISISSYVLAHIRKHR